MRWPPRRLLLGIIALLSCVAVAAVFGVYFFASRGLPSSDALRSALAGRGRVVVLTGGANDEGRLAGVRAEGTTLIRVSSVPALERALGSAKPSDLAGVLDEADVSGVLVLPPGGSAQPESKGTRADEPLRTRLRRLDYIPGLRGVHLAPEAALYERYEPIVLSAHLEDALAVVARGILAGKHPPRVSSFPDPLRQIRNVEVLVMLESDGQPRLWRSARGSSVAQALVTASTVARDRWRERQKAMGGSLRHQLDRLTVHVSFLVEDGHIASSSPAFVERAVSPEHGIGYEKKGAWYYLLPRATRERGGGSAMQAYRELFADNGLDDDAFSRPSIRLYRLVALPVGRAFSAETGAGSGSSLARRSSGSAEPRPSSGGREPVGGGDSHDDDVPDDDVPETGADEGAGRQEPEGSE